MVPLAYLLLAMAAAADSNDGTCATASDAASLLQSSMGTGVAMRALDDSHQQRSEEVEGEAKFEEGVAKVEDEGEDEAPVEAILPTSKCDCWRPNSNGLVFYDSHWPHCPGARPCGNLPRYKEKTKRIFWWKQKDGTVRRLVSCGNWCGSGRNAKLVACGCIGGIAKPTPKPTPKPIPKPTPKPIPAPTRAPAPGPKSKCDCWRPNSNGLVFYDSHWPHCPGARPCGNLPRYKEKTKRIFWWKQKDGTVRRLVSCGNWCGSGKNAKLVACGCIGGRTPNPSPKPTPKPSPAPTPPSPGTLSCGFESASQPYCGTWENKKGDQFDWSRKSGRTPSSGTGPSSAEEGRHYLFIEASWPRMRGQKAELGTNKAIPLKPGAYLKFDYHMYGSYMGSLQVFADSDVVFSKSGDQGNKWVAVNVPLDKYAGKSVNIKFVGTRGFHWKGDAAIDDIVLFEG